MSKNIQNKFLANVFRWMAIGMLVSAITSFLTLNNAILLKFIFTTPFVFQGLVIFNLLLVIFLSVRIHKLSSASAKSLFFSYSMLNGMTFASIFFSYQLSSIITIFFSTAIMFALLAIFGYTTRYDLSKIGSIAFVGLIGLVIASLVNLFLQNDTFSYIISYIGVAVFTALTMYDLQKIKAISTHMQDENSEDFARYSIIYALSLYLDFVNLFISLLNIFGSRR